MKSVERLCKLEDLRDKDVINLKNGVRIGSVDDVFINIECATIVSLVVYGRKKCFGLLGRENDVIIPWKDISVIGEDAVLVCIEGDFSECGCKKKRNFFASLFE